MLVEFITGKENIVNGIIELLGEEADEKIVVFGTIDDEGYKLFEESILKNNPKLFLGVSKKYTTKALLEKVNKLENVYVYNNNENISIKNTNMIMICRENKVDIIISTFDFFENTINNTSSFVLKLSGDSKSNIYQLYSEYHNFSLDYIKLSQEIIEQLSTDKQLRNEKASTLSRNIDKDEIIKSFRNIGQVEDKDGYLKMLEVKNEFKKSKIDKSELIYSNDSDNLDDKRIDISNLDIDIDIEI